MALQAILKAAILSPPNNSRKNARRVGAHSQGKVQGSKPSPQGRVQKQEKGNHRGNKRSEARRDQRSKGQKQSTREGQDPRPRMEKNLPSEASRGSKSRVLFCATSLEMAESNEGLERRIVLVGGANSGKSATGNAILGSEFFESGVSRKSITKSCKKKEAQLKGRKVVVVDTPGISSLYHREEDIAAEVSKCVKFCSPGPHVILHVMRILRFIPEEVDVAPQIKDALGLKARDYTILLFTHKDDLEGESLEKIISCRGKKWKDYIADCGNRCLAFNSTAEGEEGEAQVAELMTMIDDLVERNRDAPCYTEDMMKNSKIHNF
ncbi:GTPase IMAP family member 9-like [Erythrolamprus reginae]|uniref:GTPase IMAP family member 9-like n=1 Tax=Erythrolamprus reginae TaxID=121349 RepID=UPI00396C9021